MYRVNRANNSQDGKAGVGFEQIILVTPIIIEILNIR